jgi:hypothetical protein
MALCATYGLMHRSKFACGGVNFANQEPTGFAGVVPPKEHVHSGICSLAQRRGIWAPHSRYGHKCSAIPVLLVFTDVSD